MSRLDGNDAISYVLQTDGYLGYEFPDKIDGVVHAGCWEHVRRKFVEAVRSMYHGIKPMGGRYFMDRCYERKPDMR